MDKPKLLIVLAGHGGFNRSKTPSYATMPNKMHRHNTGNFHESIKKGSVKSSYFYEGHFNRQMAARIADQAKDIGLNVILLHDPYEDTNLEDRVKRVNALCQIYDCFLLEVHANASPQHNARGMEVFTTKGETRSDHLAEKYIEYIEIFNPDILIRKDFSDGDGDKENNFYVIRKTYCPAILIEHEFFDVLSGARLLNDIDFQEKAAKAAALTASYFFYN